MKLQSIKRYEAYKDSGVEWLGEVPVHWENLRLKDVIAQLESGVSVNATNEPVEGDNIGVLKTSCVGKDTFLQNQNKSVWYTEIDRVRVPVRAGRIIISRMNTPQLVGASAYISDNYPNLFLPDRLWQTVFFANRKLDTKWLSLLIGCRTFRFLLSTLATGTSPSMKNLGQEKLLSINFPFPDLPEQQAIANYLDTKTAQIDRQIDLLSKKATQYGKLKQSLINETVTRGLDKTVAMKDSGVEWIGEVPAHWGVSRLKELSNIQNSNVDKKSHENDTPVQLCNYVDVYKNEFINSSLNFMRATADESEIKRFTIKKNDVLITKDSETCDDIAIPALATESLEGVLCGYHLAQLRVKDKVLVGAYLFRLFQSKSYGFRFVISAKGITRVGLGQSAIADSLTPVPPLFEQQAIATYLDEKTAHIDRIVSTINTQIDKLKELRKALINDVVTGKIKVV